MSHTHTRVNMLYVLFYAWVTLTLLDCSCLGSVPTPLWSTSICCCQWVLFWSCCRLLRSASRLHTWFPALHSYLQWYFWSFSPVILSSQATPMMSPTLRLWWKTMSSPRLILTLVWSPTGCWVKTSDWTSARLNVCGCSTRDPAHYPVFIDNQRIKHVSSFKLLYATVTQDLS